MSLPGSLCTFRISLHSLVWMVAGCMLNNAILYLFEFSNSLSFEHIIWMLVEYLWYNCVCVCVYLKRIKWARIFVYLKILWFDYTNIIFSWNSSSLFMGSYLSVLSIPVHQMFKQISQGLNSFFPHLLFVPLFLFLCNQYYTHSIRYAFIYDIVHRFLFFCLLHLNHINSLQLASENKYRKFCFCMRDTELLAIAATHRNALNKYNHRFPLHVLSYYDERNLGINLKNKF